MNRNSYRNRRRRAGKREPIAWKAKAHQAFWASCLSILIAAFIGGCWFTYREVLASGAIDVMEIQVFGAVRVGDELGDYLQLRARTPLTHVDAGLLAGRIEKHPWVKRAGVVKKYPNRLELHIEERVPALLHLSSELYVVDLDGIWVKRFEPADELDLPVATGVAARPVTDAAAALQALASFTLFWDRPNGPIGIGEVRYIGPGEVMVYPISEGPQLLLPLDEALWPLARQRLVRVMAEAEKIGVQLQTVDLLLPDRVVAKRKT